MEICSTEFRIVFARDIPEFISGSNRTCKCPLWISKLQRMSFRGPFKIWEPMLFKAHTSWTDFSKVSILTKVAKFTCQISRVYSRQTQGNWCQESTLKKFLCKFWELSTQILNFWSKNLAKFRWWTPKFWILRTPLAFSKISMGSNRTTKLTMCTHC